MYKPLEERLEAIKISKREWARKNKDDRPPRNYDRENELRTFRKKCGYFEITIDGVKSVRFSKNIYARCSALLRNKTGDFKILMFCNSKSPTIYKEITDKRECLP